jgi:RNA polymerase sigma-70 factor (ECF subfamily)
MPDFEGVFRAHHASVFLFLRRFLSRSEDVEDCLQETFLRFWRSRDRYSDQGKTKAYIFKIARNLAIDHLRAARDRVRSLQEVGPLESPSGNEESCERREIIVRVREKVAQLPPSQRETFLLFRYHGMSYQEIAEIQGVSVKTVDSRLYRAMKRLAAGLHGLSEGGP